ncbi:MAG TPA: hypothetical protein VE955_10920 [Candidatus Dormibacteraeota bacterium]|nr:hypothetical protein [Candidatus Dormibacteraeota bacterium]
MDYTLEQLTALAGLALAPAFVAMIWMVMLHRDLRTGRRVRLRLVDLSPIRKLYLAGLVGYFGFDLYSELITIIAVFNRTGLSFLGLLQEVVGILWLGTVGLLGFVLLYTLRSPLRKTTP